VNLIPICDEKYLIQLYVISFGCDMWKFNGFILVFLFPPPITLRHYTCILFKEALNSYNPTDKFSAVFWLPKNAWKRATESWHYFKMECSVVLKSLFYTWKLYKTSLFYLSCTKTTWSHEQLDKKEHSVINDYFRIFREIGW
jgi:hypothetical protein